MNVSKEWQNQMFLDAGAATWANIVSAAANCLIDIQTETSVWLEIFLSED